MFIASKICHHENTYINACLKTFLFLVIPFHCLDYANPRELLPRSYFNFFFEVKISYADIYFIFLFRLYFY